MGRRIYLDHNATAPIHPAAAAVWRAHLAEGLPQNPSSIHWAGQASRRALAAAREQIAQLLGLRGGALIFTSSGTEANVLAVRGAALAAPPGRRRLLVSAIEHSALLSAAEAIAATDRAWAIERLPVTTAGVLDLEAAARCLGSDVALVALMLANNETGALQPVGELALLARQVGALVHCDAAQAVGKIPVDFAALGVDLLSAGGHKFGAGPGLGLLAVRQGVDLRATHPGHQEGGRRGGTESVAAAAAAAAALTALTPDLAAWGRRIAALRDRLESGATAAVAGVDIHARNAERLPHTSCLGFGGASGEALVIALDVAGIAVSSGAACASGTLEPSHVLLAMGLPPALAGAAVRFSLGQATTSTEIDTVLELLPQIVAAARRSG